MSRGQVSFGAAIVGSSNQQAACIPVLPDTWRTLLLNEHLDTWSRRSISLTCTAGRAWVAQRPKTCKLRLCLDLDTFDKDLADLQQRLSTCSPSVVQFVVQCYYSRVPAQFPKAIDALKPRGRKVTALDLSDISYHQAAKDCTSMLATAAQAFPNLHTLILGDFRGALPAPAHWPHLSELHIKPRRHAQPGSADLSSAAPYMQQLVTLRVPKPACISSESPAISLHAALTSPTTTLRCLDLSHTLTDDLLTLLLAHTPALQLLAVEDLALSSAQHATKVWALTDLRLALNFMVYGVCPHQFGFLPSTTGALRVDAGEAGPLYWQVGDKGLSSLTLERLDQWQMTGAHGVKLQVDEEVTPAEHQPTALQRSLQQLSTLQSPKWHSVEVSSGWKWTPEFAVQLTHSMAALPHLTITPDLDTLDDQKLDVLLAHGPPMTRLQPYRLDLKHDHSHQTCPWGTVVVGGHVDLVQVVRLPQWSSGAAIQVVADKQYGVSVSSEPRQADPALTRRLMSQLSRFVFSGPLCVNIHCPRDLKEEQQPAALQPCLKVLRALRVEDSAQCTAHLEDWNLSQEVMEALAGLPAWSGTLHIKGHWDDYTHGRYCQMSAYVPESFRVWRLGYMPEDALRDMVLGLVGYRKSRAPLVIDGGCERDRESVRPYVKQLGMEGWLGLGSG